MTDISPLILIALLLAAFAAGWLDSIGGGGGLIQLPALMLVFPPSAIATAMGTSKTAAVVGTSAAALNYAKSLPPPGKTLKPMMSAAFIGSALGAVAATKIDPAIFRPIILVLLVAVWVITWINPVSRVKSVADHEVPVHSLVLPVAMGLVLGFYDGLIGPGTGAFLLLGLVQLFGFSFLRASATAKFVNVATNLAAIFIFAAGGHIDWMLGIGMGIANLCGGYFGSKLAIKRGSEFVRAIMLVMVGLLIVKLASGLMG